MKLTSITTVFSETCRLCGKVHNAKLTLGPDAGHPELPLGDGIELACHEHLEEEGWTDSRCKLCSELADPGSENDPTEARQ